MAQLVVAAAGATVGFLVGGPMGAQIGWAIGSAIAAPTQKSQGPRLNDLRVVGTEYGQPIPYVEGHPRIAPQVIWASDRREIATTTEVGKGGGAESTTYTYEVDLLLLLTDNEIAGLSRIWDNGELIYDVRSTADADTISASLNTDRWTRLTLYKGDAAQLPDPTYEAAVGSANAPAYRGRGTVFIEGLQLGSGGQIPNLTCEVLTSTVAVPTSDVLLLKCDGANGSNVFTDSGGNGLVATNPKLAALTTADKVFGTASGLFSNPPFIADHIYYSSGNSIFDFGSGDWTIEAFVKKSNGGSGWLYQFGNAISGGGIGLIDILFLDSTQMSVRFRDGAGSLVFNVDSATFSSITGVWTHIAVVRHSNVVTIYVNGISRGATAFSAAHHWPAANRNATLMAQVPGTGSNHLAGWLDSFRLTKGYARYTGGAFTVPTEELSPGLGGSTYTVLDESLDDVVSRLCARAGLTAGQFDVTGLAGITKPVRALAIGQVATTRSVLELLGTTHFFECVLSDKLYFRPRGGASVVTIPYADMGASSDEGGAPEPFVLRIGNDLEIPASITVSYANVDADYNSATETSDRQVWTQGNTEQVQLAIGLTASEAKAVADAMLLDRVISRVSTEIALLPAYTRIEPTDVITPTAADGTAFRMRVVKKGDAAGLVTLEAVLDDASALVSAGLTGAYTGQTSVAAPAGTLLELLDIPILRDVDDVMGFYGAVKGDASPFPGAVLYRGLDGVTYSQVAAFGEQAVMGECATTLGAWVGGNKFDDSNTVTVDVGAGTLASATHENVLDAGANACLIGSEVLQFKTATLLSAGLYRLSGLLRGRRGTEWAMAGHAAAERFVLLQLTGLRRVELPTSDLNAERHYKAVTLGRKLSSANDETFTCTGVGLKPFAPVDLRGARDASGNLAGTFSRRTRLDVSWASTTAPPLGEQNEAYEVDVYSDGAYTTVLRTIAVTAEAFAYGAADQVTDFGSAQSTVYVDVFQLSATVGRGYPLRGAI